MKKMFKWLIKLFNQLHSNTTENYKIGDNVIINVGKLQGKIGKIIDIEKVQDGNQPFDSIIIRMLNGELYTNYSNCFKKLK